MSTIRPDRRLGRGRPRVDLLAELEGLWPAIVLMLLLAVAMTSLRLL
ncbi:hypothetical protein ACFQ0K_02275 [Nocardioides caeni]|nr:hypothetical protein [Nocardioides caeni]